MEKKRELVSIGADPSGQETFSYVWLKSGSVYRFVLQCVTKKMFVVLYLYDFY